MNHLLEHKADAGDGCNFKMDIWNGLALKLAPLHVKGRAKTGGLCKDKWSRVSVIRISYMIQH